MIAGGCQARESTESILFQILIFSMGYKKKVYMVLRKWYCLKQHE